MLISGQAIAKNMCHEVTVYKGYLASLNKGLTSETAEGMHDGQKKSELIPQKRQ